MIVAFDPAKLSFGRINLIRKGVKAVTTEEFRAWREHHFPEGRSACAAAFGLARETIDSLERGATRPGAPYPVRPVIALACVAWGLGLRGSAQKDIEAFRRAIAQEVMAEAFGPLGE